MWNRSKRSVFEAVFSRSPYTVHRAWPYCSSIKSSKRKSGLNLENRRHVKSGNVNAMNGMENWVDDSVSISVYRLVLVITFTDFGILIGPEIGNDHGNAATVTTFNRHSHSQAGVRRHIEVRSTNRCHLIMINTGQGPFLRLGFSPTFFLVSSASNV